MLTRLLRGLLLSLVLASQVQASEGNAASCASVTQAPDGKSYAGKNQCSQPVTVAYCSAGRPLWGKRCGEGRGGNLYYSHMRMLKAGETTRFMLPEGRFAFCFGHINSLVKDMPFQSDANGGYRCEAPELGTPKATAQPAADEAVYMTATVPGPDRERACRQAQLMAASTHGESTPCVCEEKSTATKKFYLCRSRSTQPSEVDAAATEDWLALQKEIAQRCRSNSDPRGCIKNNASIGVRN